jgi:ABC-type antimicrobial peptide transport system permease subunit
MSISWLLFKKSGKQSVGRLILTACAVALGVLMILAFAAGVNALVARATHSNWRSGIFNEDTSGKVIDGVDPVEVSLGVSGNLGKWQNTSITTTSVSTTGKNSPQLAGLSMPKAGEYYVSSGLDKIIKANSSANIGSRFGTKQIGVIPGDLSDSPDSLEVIRGMSQQEAASVADSTYKVYKFSDSKTAPDYGIFIYMILIFGATILLFPIVMFVAIATQLGSAQREKRYAAMRLVGATRSQITRIMALESFAAAVAGIVLGSVAYLLARILLMQFQFNGMRFWPSDITVTIGQYCLIAAITMVLCLVANWWGMRHVQTSPLGVARTQRIGKKPHFWSTLPLLLGLATFIVLSVPAGKKWFTENSSDNMMPTLALMAGILLVMFGLIWAGSWLTSKIAKLFARHTQNAQTLIATKRIAGYSKQIFRSVSGVVLALFAGSFYLTAVSGIDTLYAQSINNNGYSQLKSGVAYVSGPSSSADFSAKLNSQTYVKSSAAIYELTDDSHDIRCSDLETYTDKVCPAGSKATDLAQINFNSAVVKNVSIVKTTPAPVEDYLVKLDTNDSLDKLRTLVANESGLNSYVVSGTYAQVAIVSPTVKELGGLAYVGIGVTLFVAIASLIVSTVGGLFERQRSFMTLRLSGMTIGQMKSVVIIESLIPLIVVSLLAAGIGVWVGKVFMSLAASSLTTMLSPLYFSIVFGSLILAVVCIYLVLPILKRITSLEANRTE